MNLKSLTGTDTGEAGVNHGDNEAAAATADSVDSIVSPNECGDINLDEGQAGVSGKVMIMSRGRSPLFSVALARVTYSLPAREGSAQSRLGEGRMPSCSPGPVAAQPQWTLADPPHGLSCFPREG